MKKIKKTDIIKDDTRFKMEYEKFKKEIDSLIEKEKKHSKKLLIVTKNGLEYIDNPAFKKKNENTCNVRKNDKKL